MLQGGDLRLTRNVAFRIFGEPRYCLVGNKESPLLGLL